MAKKDEEQFVVTFDDDKVSVKRPDDVVETVTWANLDSITLEATHAGGDAAAYIWILWGEGRKSGCVFPGEATGSKDLQKELSTKLESWSTRQLSEALASTENGTYTLWQKEIIPVRKNLS